MNSPLLRRIASLDPDEIALRRDSSGNVDQDRPISRSLLLAEVQRLSKVFLELQIQGLAMLMDNCPEQVIIDLALLNAGIWALPLPPFFTQAQMQHAVHESACSHIISDRPVAADVLEIRIMGQSLFLSMINDACQAVSSQSVTSQTVVGPSATDSPVAHYSLVPPGTSKVTFTSGSTGNPKGLCLSEEQMLAPVKAIANLLDESLSDSPIRLHMSVLPYAVLLENIAGVYAALWSGVECVIPPLASLGFGARSGMDARKLSKAIVRHQAESLILVPELLRALISVFPDSNCLKFVAVGGGVIGAELLDQALANGLPVYEGYGLSEAASVVSMNYPGSRRCGSVGRPLDHHTVTIAQDGEIYLSKPAFLGYCSGEPTDQHAPLATGDIGHIDDMGYLHVTGRKKNLIITSMGRNVSPEWIESLLLASPVIVQSMVHGEACRNLNALIVSAASDEIIQRHIDTINDELPEYAMIDHWQRIAPFTVADGHLTGNGKLCRQHIINSMLT